MRIILHKTSKNKLNETIDYLINTDNRTFNKVLKALRNPDGDLDIKYMHEINNPNATLEIVKLSDLIGKLKSLDEEQYTDVQKERIEILKKCRGEEDFKKFIKKHCKISKSDYNDILSIFNGTKTFNEFIEEKINAKHKKNILSFFRINSQKALPAGNASIVDKYYNIIQNILSNAKYNFSIQENEQAFHDIELAMSVKKIEAQYSIVLGKNDEPDWQISHGLRDYVFHDMPQNLSPEEQAVWIYMKLCKTFSYDEQHIFSKIDHSSFNKTFLEGIKPNDKLICYDFSRVYAKFINEYLGDNIEAKVVGSSGHFFVELIGQDAAVKAEATNAIGRKWY